MPFIGTSSLLATTMVPALQSDLSNGDIQGMARGHWRLTAIAGITTVTVCGASAGAWALTHRQDDGPPVPKYSSARVMAQRAGCAPTFHAVPAPSGVQSAGECTVSAAVVEFRVQRVIETADPWPTTTGKHRYTCVGDGWMYRTASLGAFRQIAASVQGG